MKVQTTERAKRIEKTSFIKNTVLKQDLCVETLRKVPKVETCSLKTAGHLKTKSSGRLGHGQIPEAPWWGGDKVSLRGHAFLIYS